MDRCVKCGALVVDGHICSVLDNSPRLDRPPRSEAEAVRLRELFQRAVGSRDPEDWAAYRSAVENVVPQPGK